MDYLRSSGLSVLVHTMHMYLSKIATYLFCRQCRNRLLICLRCARISQPARLRHNHYHLAGHLTVGDVTKTLLRFVQSVAFGD